VDTLHELVQKVVEGYAVKGVNFDAYLTISLDGNLWTVVDIATDPAGRRFTATSLIVRLARDRVVIEHDDNDKPLVDALLRAGIPRQNIILAYRGEPAPEGA
jgi:hypothetical protein